MLKDEGRVGWEEGSVEALGLGPPDEGVWPAEVGTPGPAVLSDEKSPLEPG